MSARAVKTMAWRLSRVALLCAVVGAAAPAAAQKLGQGGGADVPVWRVLGALLLCLLLAAGAAFALRARLRGGGLVVQGSQRRLQLVERLRLSPQVDLCIVRVGDSEIVLATSAQGATVLSPLAGGMDRAEEAR